MTSRGTLRSVVRRHLVERSQAQKSMTDDQIWRRYQLRHLAALVTIPGILLGTGSLAAAYGTGLIGGEAEPACVGDVVPAPKRDSFNLTIMNASGINGAGRDVGRALNRGGFAVADVSNAPPSLFVKRPADIYHGPDGLDQALLVQQQIEGASLVNDARAGTGVALVLGVDFDGIAAQPAPTPPALTEFAVTVYNTTWRSGLGGDVMDELLARGYRAGESGNDPQRRYFPNDVAVIRHGPDGDLAAGLVARQFDGARLELVKSRPGIDIEVVLGSKFDTLKPAAQVEPLPPVPTPPAESVTRPCD